MNGDLSATAVVFESQGKVNTWDIELPEPGDDGVLIENVYTGISVGTESWILRGERTEGSGFPCIPGYQQTGIVAHVGSRVDSVRVGDRVNAPCTSLNPGINAAWGGHVSRSVVDHRRVVKIPDGVSLKAASLAKLFAVGYRGVLQTDIEKAELVAVVGLGMVGQGYAQIARHRGAHVFGTDLAPNRVELGGKHSCAFVAVGSDLMEAVREADPGGADVVVEATGKAELIDWCIEMVGEGGRVVWQGWYPGRVSFDFGPAHEKRVTMVFPCFMEGEDVVLDMMESGELAVEPLITHVFDAQDAAKAYELMLGDPNEFLGITLKWREE